MDHHKSLVTNEDMQINFTWDLWSLEVDLLARLIKGSKKKITPDEVSDFLRGVLERMIMESLTIDDKLAKAVQALKQEGLPEHKIKSYVNGWQQVGKSLYSKCEDLEE